MTQRKSITAAAAALILIAASLLLAAGTRTTPHRPSTTAWPVTSEPVTVLAPTATATEATTPEPCPITDEEVTMLAQTLHNEAQVVYWDGTKWGVSYKARQAAVAWCALNRYDAAGGTKTLADILSAPYQFAWSSDAEITDSMMALARDVVNRWWLERRGAEDVGRTLPADYLFFDGDGRENYFRTDYEDTGEYWDWSLPDPYQT